MTFSLKLTIFKIYILVDFKAFSLFFLSFKSKIRHLTLGLEDFWKWLLIHLILKTKKVSEITFKKKLILDILKKSGVISDIRH